MRFFVQSSLLSFVAAIALSFELPAEAQPIRELRRNTALSTQQTIQVPEGRMVAIDFSQTGEVVTFVALGDPSQFVFSGDVPLDSGGASTIFLRRIQPLDFPGATSAPTTNLTVKTLAPDGSQRLYAFDVRAGSASGSGIQIVGDPLPADDPAAGVRGATGTLHDIALGLQLASDRGLIPPEDLETRQRIREYISLVRQQVPTAQAAERAGVPLPVLEELTAIARSYYRESSRPPVSNAGAREPDSSPSREDSEFLIEGFEYFLFPAPASEEVPF